jgi:hypothetical protein
MAIDFPPTDQQADEELQKAQQAAAGPCPGCGEEGGRNAFRVKKEGPNQGRLFLKCRSCGKFDWFGAPAVADDPERAAAEAEAGPCPECGKPRRALRVKKEGANQGRLFLACSDRSCDSFEWVTETMPEKPRSAVRARRR